MAIKLEKKNDFRMKSQNIVWYFFYNNVPNINFYCIHTLSEDYLNFISVLAVYINALCRN